MRKVSRGAQTPPSALSRPNRGKQTELERVRAYVGKGRHLKKAFKFAVYKDPEVKSRLEDLFHGKCAYCESIYASTAPVDIEHYRPKGSTDDGGIGYWWLAMVWENLLPSCIDCNRRREQQLPDPTASLLTLCDGSRKFSQALYAASGKGMAFPIAGPRATLETDDLGAERPLLLDPTRDEPSDHLAFNVAAKGTLALAYPTRTALGNAAPGPSQRGAVSIQTYGLNRLGLVQERTRVIRRLEFLEGLLRDLDGVIADIKASDTVAGINREAVLAKLDRLCDRVLEEMHRMALPSAPYSVAVEAWIAAFMQRI